MGFQGNAIGTTGGVVQNNFPNQFGTALPGSPFSSADSNFIDSCPVADANGVVVGRGVVETVLGVSVATVTGTNITTGTSQIGTAVTNITAGYLQIVGLTPTPMYLSNISFASVTGYASLLALLNAMTGIGTGVWTASTHTASSTILTFTSASYGSPTVTVTDLNAAGASTGLAAALGLTSLTIVNGVQQPIRTGLGSQGVSRPATGNTAANFYGVALRTLAGFNVNSIQSVWPYQANAPIMRPTRAGGRVWVESFDTIAVDGAVYLVTVADTCTAGTSYHPVGSFTTGAAPAGATTAAGYAAGTAVLLANAKFKSVGVAGTPVVGGEATPGGVVLIEFTGAAG